MHMNDSQYKLKWEKCPRWDEVHILRCCHPCYKNMTYRIKPLDSTPNDWQANLYDVKTGKENIILNGDLLDCMLQCQEDAGFEYLFGKGEIK